MIDFSGDRLPSVDEVVFAAQPVAETLSVKGVYFLLQNNTVVYVGSSVSVYSRIETHITENVKEFDAYSILRCPDISQDRLFAFEAFYVLKFQPKYNWGIPGNPDFISNKQIKSLYGVGAHQLKRLIKEGTLKPFGEFQGLQYFLSSHLNTAFGGVA